MRTDDTASGVRSRFCEAFLVATATSTACVIAEAALGAVTSVFPVGAELDLGLVAKARSHAALCELLTLIRTNDGAAAKQAEPAQSAPHKQRRAPRDG